MCNRINCQKIFIKNKNFSKEKLTKTFLQKSKDVKLIKTEVHSRPKQTDKRECFSTIVNEETAKKIFLDLNSFSMLELVTKTGKIPTLSRKNKPLV